MMLLRSDRYIPRRQALFLLALGVPAATAQGGKGMTKRDLFPAFFEFWKESGGLSRELRAERFLRLVVEPNAELYEAFTGSVSIARATRYLAQVEPLLTAIQSLHGWVQNGGVDAEIANMQSRLSDFRWRGILVFMPNLFVFDAGGGPLNGQDVLIFGLDTIAKRDGANANLSVLIAHEVFHCYHAGFHPEWDGQHRGVDTPLYQLVWKEGLATYAAQVLSSGAGLDAVFNDPALRPSCEARLAELAKLLREQLDRVDKEPFMEWMSARARASHVPPRAGYYFGWRMATELGRTHSLRELARLSDGEVRRAMGRVLDRLSSAVRE